MRAFLKVVFVLLVLLALGVGGAWLWAGRMAGPAITIRQPDAFIGQTSSLDLTAETPDGRFSRLDAVIEQNGMTYTVFTLDQPAQAQGGQESANRLYVIRPIGKRDVLLWHRGSLLSPV